MSSGAELCWALKGRKQGGWRMSSRASGNLLSENGAPGVWVGLWLVTREDGVPW